ncbi:putative arylsulfatase regulatory protein [Vibrio ishigakensis]|uniref:Putative arylsulfatase regulatory protein n=1 Tax=Vibrio ishigakensis TaxID=1481914 RepID=A0A0B8NM10_9VIBR|nr:putative arylsulfatase regulatory protein [Vibrio ishigakensis]
MTSINNNHTFNGSPIKRTHIMAKPIGAACNIDCTYCYYLSKQDLLEYKKGCTPKLNQAELENYIKIYIESHNAPEIIFSWQGGEPTLLAWNTSKPLLNCNRNIVLQGSQLRMTCKPTVFF